jgi:hypothetical protein
MQESVTGITPMVRGQANAEVTQDEQGSVRVSHPGRDAGGGGRAGGFVSIMEEDVRDRVADAVRYAGWLLEHIDPKHRVAIACRLDGVGYLPWRTRAEVAASPDRAAMSLFGRHLAGSTTNRVAVPTWSVLLLMTTSSPLGRLVSSRGLAEEDFSDVGARQDVTRRAGDLDPAGDQNVRPVGHPQRLERLLLD